MITVDITVRYDTDKVISASAKSEDIDSINNTMIDTMRFQFVKKEILKTAVNNRISQCILWMNFWRPIKMQKKYIPPISNYR